MPGHKSNWCQVWDDNLLFVSICCLSLASQELIIVGSTGMEITGPHTANWMCDWLVMYFWGIMHRTSYTHNLVPSDFHHLGPFCQHKQAVTCHQTLDINCFCVWIQVFGARCDKCLIISLDYMAVWCVPSATMWRVYSFVILYLCYDMLYLICHRWICGM